MLPPIVEKANVVQLVEQPIDNLHVTLALSHLLRRRQKEQVSARGVPPQTLEGSLNPLLLKGVESTGLSTLGGKDFQPQPLLRLVREGEMPTIGRPSREATAASPMGELTKATVSPHP